MIAIDNTRLESCVSPYRGNMEIIYLRKYMIEKYPVIPIADDAPELPEQLGTKTKYWLHIDGKQNLLKIGRPNTGEN